MGNYRFRFSDMIPNAWFYKLRDMAKHNTSRNNLNLHPNNNNSNSIGKKAATKKSPPNNNHPSEIMKIPLSSADQRKSYYFTRDITFHHQDPPRKSSRIRSRRRQSSSVSAGCSCRAAVESFADENGSTLTDADFDLRPDLAPIITKKPQQQEQPNQKSEKRGLTANSASSPGVRLRTKVASRRIVQGRKSASRRAESFAVVKTSKDPGRDFRESMAEMIAENNIRAAKDLEELLACYLSLNSDEYHQVIIDVFKQIWFDTHN